MWKILNGIKASTPIKRNLLAQLCRLGSTSSTTDYKREMETFQGVYPGIMKSLNKCPGLHDNPDAMTWVKKIMDYNLRGGKKSRGVMTISTYDALSENKNDKNLEMVKVLGWCVEMVQAYFLMTDDILDNSLTRRGEPCWFLLPEVGRQAVNDCGILLGILYEILKTYCAGHKNYLNMVQLVNESLLYTSIGQHLDYATSNSKGYKLYTPERYSNIVKFKTSYYTFKLPVFLGMMASNIPARTHSKAEEICLALGYLFQMQDDFMDVFTAKHVIGKSGTDIQERKCSWLAVQALQRANAKQKDTFTTCYGSPDLKNVERIKELYKELNLPEVFQKEEANLHKNIVDMSQAFDFPSMPGLFNHLLRINTDARSKTRSTNHD
ncbi:unnamed protein product [Leptosia nina]|uniref:Farnesyl pyrophosphate synthase n=1 Tax=Leptosia nina TaxID=320188 RepID=A0AAV1K2T5_9NEOP